MSIKVEQYITKGSDGSYSVRVSGRVGDKIFTRRKRGIWTLGEARGVRGKFMAELAQQKERLANGVLWKDALENYLKMEPNIQKPKTFQDVSTALRAHTASWFDKTIQEVTEQDVWDFERGSLADATDATRNKVAGYVSRVFAYYLKRRRVQFNPAIGVHWGSKRKPEKKLIALLSLAFRNKKVIVQFFRHQRRKAVFCQCILLQTSGWIKGCYRSKVRMLAKYSEKSELHWIERTYKLGPRHGTKSWANAIEMGSNYVRHKDEWRYNWIDFDKTTGKLKSRRNIVGTMPTGQARKNAHFLIELGVSEDDLFGISRDSCASILELLHSDTIGGLKENCEKWLNALNQFTDDEMQPLIRAL